MLYKMHKNLSFQMILPDCSFHWITILSTMGEAASRVHETLTLLLVISRMVKLSGVGGGSEIQDHDHHN